MLQTVENYSPQIHDPLELYNPVILSTEFYRVREINTWEGSQHFGKDRGWCTAKFESNFNSYKNKGFLYMIYRHEKLRPQGQLWVHKLESRHEIKAPFNQYLSLIDLVEKDEIFEAWIKEQMPWWTKVAKGSSFSPGYTFNFDREIAQAIADAGEQIQAFQEAAANAGNAFANEATWRLWQERISRSLRTAADLRAFTIPEDRVIMPNGNRARVVRRGFDFDTNMDYLEFEPSVDVPYADPNQVDIGWSANEVTIQQRNLYRGLDLQDIQPWPLPVSVEYEATRNLADFRTHLRFKFRMSNAESCIKNLSFSDMDMVPDRVILKQVAGELADHIFERHYSPQRRALRQIQAQAEINRRAAFYEGIHPGDLTREVSRLEQLDRTELREATLQRIRDLIERRLEPFWTVLS